MASGVNLRNIRRNVELVNKDKLDKLQQQNSIRSNFIKWWNVKVQTDEEMAIEEEPNLAIIDVNDIADDRERDVIANALSLNDRSNIFAELMEEGVAPEPVEENTPEADALLDEANAIYERLMAEAAADEAKKAAEIEALKAAMENA